MNGRQRQRVGRNHFYPHPRNRGAQVMADAEAGMEEILPVAARTALLDYKPGDVVIAPTGRGWHIVKVRDGCKKKKGDAGTFALLARSLRVALLARSRSGRMAVSVPRLLFLPRGELASHYTR